MDPIWESAVERGDAGEIRDLLERGADPDARDRYGQTALMRAARDGHDELARALIEAGAALDVTAKYGLSALMLAALNGREAIALALARAGADRSIRGTGAPGFAGRTAAELARQRGLETLAAALETPSTET